MTDNEQRLVELCRGLIEAFDELSNPGRSQAFSPVLRVSSTEKELEALEAKLGAYGRHPGHHPELPNLTNAEAYVAALRLDAAECIDAAPQCTCRMCQPMLWRD